MIDLIYLHAQRRLLRAHRGNKPERIVYVSFCGSRQRRDEAVALPLHIYSIIPFRVHYTLRSTYYSPFPFLQMRTAFMNDRQFLLSNPCLSGPR